MKIGNYVQYKSEIFIVCEIIGDKAKILSPTIGKRFVKMDKLTYTNKRPAKLMTFHGTQYLVTGKDMIISLATNKIMKWKQYHNERVTILRTAKQGAVSS